MEINEFLSNAKVVDLRFVRGLQIVPARFEIDVDCNGNIYTLEAEVNFRVLYKNKMLVCFQDLFLEKNYTEMSIKKYRSQKNIEKTLLYNNIQTVMRKIINRRIRKVHFFPYGDVIVYISRQSQLHFINDTHENDSCVFRIVSKSEFQTFEADGGSFALNKLLFEVKNINGEIVTVNELSKL